MKLLFNKKTIFSFIAVITVSFLVFGAGSIYAEINIGGQEHFEQKLSQPGVGKEAFDFQSLYGTVASLNVLLLGCADASCPKEISNGAVQGMGNAIAALYSNPPASGAEYLASVGRNIGLAPKVYAQEGTGFTALRPIQGLWRAFRNIAYIFFVIFFVAIGLAIMFRVKISPQAVVTIQSAIPRIIVALLLVTFSYAIAGLMIDLMYVFLVLFIEFLASQQLVGAEQLSRQYLDQGLWAVTRGLFAGTFGAADDIWRSFYSGAGPTIVTVVIGALVGTLIAPGPGTLIGLAAGALGGGFLTTTILLLILSIVLLFALLRIFFILLVSYISIIFLVIFGPLIILFDALPVQTGIGVGMWFKNLFANIIVFPVAAILIIIGTILTNTRAIEWVPPLLPQLTGPVVVALLGVGILLFLGQILNTIKKAMQTVTFERGIEGAVGTVGGAGRFAFFQGTEVGLRRAEDYGARAQGTRLGEISRAVTPVIRRVAGLRRAP